MGHSLGVSPSTDVVGFGQELVVIPFIEDACPTEDRTFAGTPGGNANKKGASDTPSSWEDIAALLKRVPCFTAPKPPTSGVEEFFPFSHRHFVDLRGDPYMAGVVRPSHVTPDSAHQGTYSMLKYTTEETTKVVGFTPSFAQVY